MMLMSIDPGLLFWKLLDEELLELDEELSELDEELSELDNEPSGLASRLPPQ
jgi:hypothetical protein